ncbi:hypothetical protein PVL29_001442 [Vitis rotundifolia]|nr:hypothetical protein PVL29_001442 [Vitis rotundifolia]
MQSAISKINPDLLKTVIASGSVSQAPKNNPPFASRNSLSVPSTPKSDQNYLPALPVYSPVFRPVSAETTPITIFYNGTVSVFDVSPEQIESIMKLALDGSTKTVEPADSKLAIPPNEEQQLLETLNGDLPLARRKSLHRFLEKRKERLTSVSPYPPQIRYAVSDQEKITEELFRA